MKTRTQVFTYFFHNLDDGLTKIGQSRSPGRRFKGLCHGRNLIPICVSAGNTERDNHRKYAEFREHGEWFRLPTEILAGLGRISVSDIPEGAPAPSGFRSVTIKMRRSLFDRIATEAAMDRRTISNFLRFHIGKLLDERDAADTETTNTSEV